MTIHGKKLDRDIRREQRKQPPSEEVTLVDKEFPLLFRQVVGRSIDKLRDATKGVRTGNADRVTNEFILALAYKHQLERAREDSPLERPPSARMLTRQLGELSVASFHEPVEARVQAVEPHGQGIGVVVDYEQLSYEMADMKHAVRETLGLPEDYEFMLGALESGITVIQGGPIKAHQLDGIREAMPSPINLSAIGYELPSD